MSAQTVSIMVKNTSIEKVFRLIEKQADVSFFYKVESLKGAGNISIKVTNLSLKETLELCFQNQPLAYEVIDKTIVVKEKPSYIPPQKSLSGLPVRTTSITVRGRIETTQGEPVEMASITIKGTKKATSSKASGEFSINVENGKTILEVSSVGIEPVEILVGTKTELKIVVNNRVTWLDDVQIIGYGQTTRRLNTGNVITIKSDKIEKQPVTNILAALEGHVPGLIVSQNTGVTGGSYVVNIRGKSSLQAGSDPLFLVDGVPYPAGAFSINNDYKQGGNGLNLLNISDIERVEVLKDADATAIYGSRGGNGVVLITTKKGKPGKPVINVNMYTGIGKITRGVKLLNLKQYLEMRRESYKNDNLSISPSDNSMNGKWDTTRSTNWQKELLGGTAKTTDAQLSISGGSGNMSYLVNGGYHRETTVMPVAGSARQYALHFNLSNAFFKRKFKIELSTNYQAGVDDLPPIDFTGVMQLLIPHQPVSFSPDGSLNSDPSMILNPYAKLKELYKMNTNNLVGNLKFLYKPVKGLELRASLGYQLQTVNDFKGVPVHLAGRSQSWARYGANNSHTFIVEPEAFYLLNLKGKGKLSVLIGGTYEKTATSYEIITASNFSSDELLSDIAAAGITQIFKSSSSNYRYLGAFSRLSYNLHNKYLINLTGRVDGTSRFGPGKQFHPFGSAGVAWVFSDERFMKNLKWVNLAKLRGSFGFIGNSNIPDHAFLASYTQYSGVPYQSIQTLVPNRLYNPDLGWEVRKSLEVGLEMQLFKNRLAMSLSAYRNRNSQQLLNNTLSAVTGINSVLENSSSVVENKGFEVVLSANPLTKPHFSWQISANISFQKNTLLAFNNVVNTKYNYLLGKSITSEKVYQFGGVDPDKGTYFFIDRNGRPVTTPTNEDLTAVINIDPRSYGSITNSFTWKRVSMDITCLFMDRQGRNVLGQMGYYPPGSKVNQPAEVLSRWQKPGDNTDVGKYSSGSAVYASQRYFLQSSAAFGNASYVRVRNLSVSYKCTSALLQTLHLQNLRFYLRGQNLFTFSRYKNLDPENVDYNNSSMPPLRVVTAGFQIAF
jgi:TonB-linked SusC/RagA family outer membrane protein